MDSDILSGDIIMQNAINLTLKNIEDELEQLQFQANAELIELEKIDDVKIKKCSSSLDAWDYCFCIAVGFTALYITTNEQLAVYLEEIHKAASGAQGDYDKLQTILGGLLFHKGDYIDIVDKCFKNRKGENAYGAFHRLLWGHDIFSKKEDNPFLLMYKQKGLSGIIQAFQHLVADTASKQGLPLPGSSYLDFEKENGSVSNYLIKIAEGLSESSVGNKQLAQSIYSHAFTIRAQDCIGNVTIESLSLLYTNIRHIDSAVRITQFKLISYIISFVGHSVIGAFRQYGIPYINISEFKGLVHNFVKLYVENSKETKKLESKQKCCIEKSIELLDVVDNTTRNIMDHSSDDYLEELDYEQANVMHFIRMINEEDCN